MSIMETTSIPEPPMNIQLSYVDLKQMKPRSQKAQGLIAMATVMGSFGRLPFNASQLRFALVQNPLTMDDSIRIAEMMKSLGMKLFVRPCPVTPRHGFADSRPVLIKRDDSYDLQYGKFIETINAILAEAQAIDPGAELIIMQFVDAKWNMVYAGESITIGEGNDGATSGTNAISVPCMPVTFDEDLVKKAGIEHSVFAEFVSSDNGFSGTIHSDYSLYMTQLRDGPAISSKPRFIPVNMTVKEVITIPVGHGPSLLTWEKQCLDYAKKSCLVVYHPGGTLATHYAIHCRLNNIAIVCDKEPKVGEFLDCTETNQKVTEPNREHLRAAMLEAATWRYNHHQADNFNVLPLYVLHNFAAFDLSVEQHVRILGWGLEASLRYCIAALWGERRHGGIPERLNGTATERILKGQQSGSPHRNVRYTQVMSASKFEDMAANVALESVAFGYYGWASGLYDAGAGGFKWLQCADLTYVLWNKVSDYLAGLCPFRDVMIALNGVVNVSHNCAKLLTKHIPGIYFDNAAKTPHQIAMMMARGIYRRLQNPTAFVQHKKPQLKLLPIIVPSTKLRDEKLVKSYDLLLRFGGNKVLAAQFENLPDLRTGDDWTVHAHNCIRDFIWAYIENNWKSYVEDNGAAGPWPNLTGPWSLDNPWFNPYSPVNNHKKYSIPTLAQSINNIKLNGMYVVDPHEKPSEVLKMKKADPTKGEYPWKWSPVYKQWQVNDYYKPIPIDLGKVEEAILAGKLGSTPSKQEAA